MRKQKKYNKVLSSTRLIVENSFGLLKGKFHRIKTFLDVTGTVRASRITAAACVLHNIYIQEKDWYEDEIIDEGNSTDSDSNDDDNDMFDACPSGNEKRNIIVDYLV